ncbi:LLM class flavin-dependent oxidoreductase [Amycolatopsis jiangsuensis]|uniref:Alkanesulfonate monooxygenase SsuD/methylene tetrahydromethanopterin reductase-like flavin-dependent oxidoreductase (Luciferase family) n=1 Tax=Amycolatopsis jiangsuensis TaxID=1181879 RepID=A0A840IRJ5_9PSEU|nr:LLM class flavin-dependent oxidoreductase [Amycolatopsis jiangsuensis]MBB4683852.1 alkanesulfonate monooxygenase SsuD/methylene tetrahydromethanopterin reductase-like flavin-dependent oxidoreductase (luciferase family) [Amycolatopsis jiangsuensis]
MVEHPWPRFGVLFHGWATADREDSAVLGEACRSAVLADRLGFDVAWFTEQHAPMFGAISGRIAAPHLLIARLAGETEHIGLGTAVRLIVEQTPRQLAEEFVTLDLLTAGRAWYGIGAGRGDPALGAAGRARRRDTFRRRARELTEILRTGGEGHELGLRIRDLSARVLVASAGEQSIAFAARNGLGYFVGMFGGHRHPGLTRDFRDLGGRGPVRAARLVFVAEDDRTAHRAVADAAQYFWAHFTPPSPAWHERVRAWQGDWRTDDICAQLGWVVGGPATVARRLADYIGDCRLDALDVSFQVPGLPAERADRSMALFAQEVVPRVRAGLSSPARTGRDLTAAR